MILVLVGLAGCSCNPPLPQDSPGTDSGGPVDPSAPDSAAPPPCAYPESEPNNGLDDADELVPEQRACGTIAADDPTDNFSVELDDDGWIEIEVRASSGSIADLVFEFSNEDFLIVAEEGLGTTDPTRLFQVPAGRYRLGIRERNGQGGERYGYEALVSEAKAPVEWDFVEEEPNDDAPSALQVFGGDALFGTMESADAGTRDEDWYVLGVPDGRHDVVIDIDAMEQGSSANTEVRVYNNDGGELTLVDRITGGIVDATFPDPDGIYPSLGDEVLWLSVSQQGQNAREGIDYWYVLNVSLEAR